jgi:hypothetical protein
MLAALDAHEVVIKETIAREFLEEYLTVEQTANCLGISGLDVCRLITSGAIPAYRFYFPSGQISMPLRLRRGDVAELLRAERADPPDVPPAALYYMLRPSPLRKPSGLGWLLSAIGVWAVTLALYLALPSSPPFGIAIAILLGAVLTAYFGGLVFLLRRDYNTGPTSSLFWARAVGLEPVSALLHLLTTTVLLSQLVFASLYWYVGLVARGAFSESLSRIDALYLSVTTFTTTGYGDIHPTIALTRALTIGQMSLTFVLVAVVISMVVRRVTAPGAERFVDLSRHASSGWTE